MSLPSCCSFFTVQGQSVALTQAVLLFFSASVRCVRLRQRRRLLCCKYIWNSDRQGLCAHAEGTVGVQWQESPSPSGASAWQHKVNAPSHQANHWPWEIHYLGDRHLFNESAKGTRKQKPPWWRSTDDEKKTEPRLIQTRLHLLKAVCEHLHCIVTSGSITAM